MPLLIFVRGSIHCVTPRNTAFIGTVILLRLYNKFTCSKQVYYKSVNASVIKYVRLCFFLLRETARYTLLSQLSSSLADSCY